MQLYYQRLLICVHLLHGTTNKDDALKIYQLYFRGIVCPVFSSGLDLLKIDKLWEGFYLRHLKKIGE